jgi:hypothetical protein
MTGPGPVTIDSGKVICAYFTIGILSLQENSIGRYDTPIPVGRFKQSNIPENLQSMVHKQVYRDED